MRERRTVALAWIGLIGTILCGKAAQADTCTLIFYEVTTIDCYTGSNGYQCDVEVSGRYNLLCQPGSPWLNLCPNPPDCATIGTNPNCSRTYFSLGLQCVDQTCYRWQCLDCCEQIYPCTIGPLHPPCAPESVQAGLIDYADWAAHELCVNGCQAL